MARIAGVDLPREKRVEIALTYRHVPHHQSQATGVRGQHALDLGIEQRAGLARRIQELDDRHLGVGPAQRRRAGAYQRRGAIFSDHQIISRESLIQKIKSGKKFVTGRRVIGMASTFEIAGSVSVVSSGDKEILVTDNHPSNQDFLEGIPVI